MSGFIPSDEFVIYESTHWRVNHRVDSALPGYLMVAAKDYAASGFAQLSRAAQLEFGLILGMVTSSLEVSLRPDHVHVCRFGHDLGHAVHFHVIPVYHWIKDAYRRFIIENQRAVNYPSFLDGPSLTLFISEEFKFQRSPCDVPQPTVRETIEILRAALWEAARQADATHR